MLQAISVKLCGIEIFVIWDRIPVFFFYYRSLIEAAWFLEIGIISPVKFHLKKLVHIF